MKYLGQKSLSSFLNSFLRISWYIILIIAILMGIIGSYLFFSPIDDPIVVKTAAIIQADIYDKDWVTFKHLPVIVRLLIVPYFIAVVAFLLKLIRMAQLLFENFSRSIVFDKGNVKTIAALGKTLIPFSILTFNFSGFFTALLLLLICEIFKNGTFLQEEHDLTV